jgi:hypothetical protein
MADDRKPLPRSVRGGRKFFFDDPAVDKVLAMLLTLASEVWALRERMAAIEAVAAKRGLPLDLEIERHEFTPEQEATLAKLRNDFIGGLFRILSEPAPAAAAATRKNSPSKSPSRKKKTPRRARRPK